MTRTEPTTPPENTWIWIIKDSDSLRSGERADRAILEALEHDELEYSRSFLQKLMQDGHVLKNGSPCKASEKLEIGDRIEIRFPPPRTLELTPEDHQIPILFEDEHLVVIDKPAGMTVHPSETQLTGTLVHALLFQIPNLSGIGGVMRPGIVHRLDKDTSGVMVVSKSDTAHRALVDLFSAHELERKYWALCYGVPADVIPGPSAAKSYRYETLIARNPNDRVRMTSDSKLISTEKGARKAISNLRWIERFDRFACLIEAELETGRTHQVRVHLTALGNSLLGDPLYGTPSSNATKWKALPAPVRPRVSELSGQALHARVLGFKHPITGEALRFEQAPPPAFQNLLAALKEHSTA